MTVEINWQLGYKGRIIFICVLTPYFKLTPDMHTKCWIPSSDLRNVIMDIMQMSRAQFDRELASGIRASWEFEIP